MTATWTEGASPARSPLGASGDASRLDPTDTIAAISSPSGPALRGIVRLSGPRAVEVTREGFTPDDDVPWTGLSEHRSGRLAVAMLGRSIAARLIVWPGTSSYTGGPCAEVHTTGSGPVLRAVLADMVARGARLAEPGEFTLRAFLAGKIDLTRAEAVLGVIEAEDSSQLAIALEQLAGGIAGPIEALRDRLLDLLAHLEADLDFADEPDVDPLGRNRLAEELAGESEILLQLAGRLDSRERGQTRPRVLLYGPPNAGKSRLFNALMEGGRALVSPEPGTTRDTLLGVCLCDGLEIELVDSAGVESPRSDIEVGAKHARDRELELADLVVVCHPMDEAELLANPEARRRLEIVTKCDLPGADVSCLEAPRGGWTPTRPESGPPSAVPRKPEAQAKAETAVCHKPEAQAKVLLRSSFACASGLWHLDGDSPTEAEFTLRTSAETGVGLDAVRFAIARSLRDSRAGDAVPGTSERCRESLLRAGESLQSAASTLTLGGGDELVAIDLRGALDDLGRVVGAVASDDVLDRIFRKFCIGK